MRRFMRLVNEISLGWMLAALTAVIAVFGLAYWLLEPLGAGIQFTYATAARPSLGDSLYFSLVTISSLGYGDIRPVGLSRLLVGGEVIIGLSFFGLIVAKISSVKQDYILRRLYSEKVEAEVRRYIEELEDGRELYRITSGLLIREEIDPSQTTTFRAEVAEVTLFYRLELLATSMRDMMAFEVRNSALFGDVPDAAISRLYAGWQDVLAHTAQLWTDDPDATCDLVLCGNEERVEAMLAPVRDMARMGLRESRSDAIRMQCRSLLELATQLSASVLPAARARTV